MKLLSDYEKRKLIEKIDLEIWSAFAPQVVAGSSPGIVYRCYCPHCQAVSKKTQKNAHNLTAVVYRHQKGWGEQGDGLGFSCVACGVKHPRVFQFLGGAGSAAAEEYAEKRLEIDAAGKGWYCPSPQRWKQDQEQKKRLRAAEYREEAERRKSQNKIINDLRRKTLA